MVVSRHWMGNRRVGTECTCTSTVINLLCSPWYHSFSSPGHWAKCSILLIEVSSKSPVFIIWQPSACILMWSKPHICWEHVRPFQMSACTCHTQEDYLPAIVEVGFLLNDSSLKTCIRPYWRCTSSGAWWGTMLHRLRVKWICT